MYTLYSIRVICKNWRVSSYKMIDECIKNDTIEDRNSARYGKQTDKNILEHVHRIITEVS